MIPIEFVLKTSTANFTRGLAAAQNGISGLRQKMAGIPVGRMLGVAGAVVAIAKGFQQAIANAQSVRDEMEKLGKPIDRATMHAAQLGDGFAEFGKRANRVFTEIVSWGPRLAEFFGILDKSLDPEVAAAAARGAMEQDKAKAALTKLEEQREKFAYEAATSEEKVNLLLARQVALMKEKAQLDRSDPVQRARLHDLTRESEAIGQEIKAEVSRGDDARSKKEKAQADFDAQVGASDKKIGEATNAVSRAKANLRTEILGDVLPTIEELAAQGGTAASGKARRALELEMFAYRAKSEGPRGFDSAVKFSSQAAELRASLAGVIQGEDADTQTKAALDAVKVSQEELAELKEIARLLKGKFKAEA